MRISDGLLVDISWSMLVHNGLLFIPVCQLMINAAGTGVIKIISSIK